MNGKKIIPVFRLFVVVAFCVGVLTTGMVVLADMSDWATKKGLLEKTGNDDEGYNIISEGDAGSAVANYEKPFNIMKTQIRFSFDALPFEPSEKEKEAWAYIGYTLDPEEKKMLYSYEESQKIGRMEFIIWHRADGTCTLALFTGGEAQIFKLENFDFTAEHTILFTEKLGGIYLVFDGIPMSTIDFHKVISFHTGENAGKTYLRIGGQQVFHFKNLRFEEVSQPASLTSDIDNASSTSSHSAKLGDIETEDENNSKPADTEYKRTGINRTACVAVGTAVIIMAAGAGAAIIIIKRRKNI